VSELAEHLFDFAPLRLVWSRPVDRWQHRVEWIAGSGRADSGSGVWAESVEGAPADEWPPSPVFQDLFVEPRPNGGVEYQLMGQCGRTIYTAAVLCDPVLKRIEFDVCARVRREPLGTGLVSTYRRESPANTDEIPLIGPRFVVNGETGVGGRLAPDRRQWTVGRFGPLEVDTQRGTLYRWRYGIECG
jgi:hypothetical protein